MQIQYNPLFSIRLKHDYFPEGKCQGINIVPTTETAQRMQTLGIRLVARDFGAELFYESGSTPQRQLLHTDAPIHLSFLLRSTDPLFFNYTGLPAPSPPYTLHYLTNLSPQQRQPQETFNVGDGELLPLVSGFFDIEITQGKPITLKDELGFELSSFTGKEETEDQHPFIRFVKADLSKIEVNLSSKTEGYYTLMQGEESLKKVINAPKNFKPGDTCLLSIYLGDTGTTGKHILKDGAVEPAAFNLTFHVRETNWRYFLIDHNNTGYSNFQLVDANTQLPIALSSDSPTTKTLPDGKTAVVLAVEKAIPLQQRPENHFLLKMESPGQSKPISINLPSPDASRISLDESSPTDESEAPTFYSDMYVYV